jgi:queuosine biosynthesis protein QueD
VEIGKKWSFSAAHHLPNHFGKCAGPHGHNYTVEVVLVGVVKYSGTTESDYGMLYDYYHLGEVWKEIESILDHKDLNAVLPELHGATTAENLACWLFGRFVDGVAQRSVWDDVNVVNVIVSETDGTFAKADQDDWEEYDRWQLACLSQ